MIVHDLANDGMERRFKPLSLEYEVEGTRVIRGELKDVPAGYVHEPFQTAAFWNNSQRRWELLKPLPVMPIKKPRAKAQKKSKNPE